MNLVVFTLTETDHVAKNQFCESLMKDDGFQIKENVLSHRECESLAEELSCTRVARTRAGVRNLMTHATVTKVANDDRLVRIAREILGQEAVPYRAILFEKSGLANWLVPWHQDKALPLESFFSSPEWGPWSKKAGILYAHAPAWALKRVVALRIHLDISTAENGPLRIIPGSHASGVLTHDEVFEMARRREYVHCFVSRGGVLTMSPLLVHSSSKSFRDVQRRVLHVEYADALRFGESIRLAIA